MTAESFTVIIQAFGICISIGAGIAFVYFGIKSLSLYLFNGRISKVGELHLLTLDKFISPGSYVNISLSGSKVIENVKYIGFADFSKGADNVPFAMHSWVVLESSSGKVFVKPEQIKFFQKIDGPNQSLKGSRHLCLFCFTMLVRRPL